MRPQKVLLVLAAIALVVGLSQWKRVARVVAAQKLRSEFQRQCPRPEWWDRVQAPRIRTRDEFSEYWRRKDRSPEQFFKVAYQAIVDYPLDTDLVMEAIQFLYYSDQTYPYMIRLHQFALDRYFSYRRPLAGYGGKAGDTVGGIVLHLTYLYKRKQQYDQSITVINRLLSERKQEIHDNLLELLSLALAEALQLSGRSQEAQAVLREAIETYQGDGEANLKQVLASHESP